MGTLRIEIRNVYGVLNAYPICEKSKLLAEIAGTKTLTHRTLAIAERMGFTIESVSAFADYKAVR